MLTLILTWFLSAAALMITSKLVSGFEIKDFKSAMIASIVVGFLNMTLRWILIILTLPINIITLGLFTFVVNAMILKAAAAFMESFKIKTWGSAIIGALVLAIVNVILFGLI
jgi:putative membrane protein